MPKREPKPVMDYKARCELIEEHVKAILEIMDEPMRPGLDDTPNRVARISYECFRFARGPHSQGISKAS